MICSLMRGFIAATFHLCSGSGEDCQAEFAARYPPWLPLQCNLAAVCKSKKLISAASMACGVRWNVCDPIGIRVEKHPAINKKCNGCLQCLVLVAKLLAWQSMIFDSLDEALRLLRSRGKTIPKHR